MEKKKIIKSEVKPEWRLLHEVTNPRVDKLYDIYRMDKQKASVIYNQDTNNYTRTRVVLFEHLNGDFRIARFNKKTGISINGIIYNRESTLEAITYKGKKFYYSSGKKLVQLTYNHLTSFITNFNYDRDKVIETYQYLLKKFGWLRNLGESNIGWHISFNTIIGHKLYNEKSIIRYIFGTTYPTGKLAMNATSGWGYWQLKNDWKTVKRVCVNLENISAEMINSQLFFDTVRMGNQLGYKLNCSWSMKRFKREHDKWMKEVIAIILEFEPLRELRLNKVFKDFAVYSGYELLLTNHDLIEEGKSMNHCVGTYSYVCDNGTSGIYRVDGYTVELTVRKAYNASDKAFILLNGNTHILSIGQIQGYSNSLVPVELRERIELMVLEFNKMGFKVEEYNQIIASSNIDFDDNLPF